MGGMARMWCAASVGVVWKRLPIFQMASFCATWRVWMTPLGRW